MDEMILSRIRKEAYEQGYQDGKVDGYNLAGKILSSAQPDMSEYSDKLWKSAYERGKAQAQQWIPVTERLPKDKQRVIVQMEHGYTTVIDFSAVGLTSHIVAWMPLPSPYEYPPKDFMNPPEGEEE